MLTRPILTLLPQKQKPVYVQHFKCNIRDIRSGYPHLHKVRLFATFSPLAVVVKPRLITHQKWMRNLYWNHPAFKDTANFLHIKSHYTKSHTQINPFSITPVGPLPDILPLDDEVPAVKSATGK